LNINNRFTLLKNIFPEKKNSWAGKIAITFDVDWACDEVFEDTVNLVKEFKIPATWFITHDTPILKLIRRLEFFELGIHPNFNPLFSECNNKKNFLGIVNEVFSIVPEARSFRSHSLVQSSLIQKTFKNLGMTHESNTFIPCFSKIKLGPWRTWNDLISVPYFWEDDTVCGQNLLFNELCDPVNVIQSNCSRSLMVFDFHPIHVFLNTESLERYENTRSIHKNAKALINYRYKGYGTRSRLIKLLETAF
jgi:hypothetical protein